jgi:hypothetical protein
MFDGTRGTRTTARERTDSRSRPTGRAVFSIQGLTVRGETDFMPPPDGAAFPWNAHPVRSGSAKSRGIMGP